MGNCQVRIPATSANMGSGFDTIGVALKLYNTVTVEETDSGLEIEVLDASKKFLPKDERNLVYRGIKTVFDHVDYKCNGLKIVLNNEIPVTRGLGSSSSGIVGGLLAGNYLSGNTLSTDELVNLACKLEGHPDNTTPALTGGFAVAVKTDPVSYIKLPAKYNDLRLALFIPDFPLNTVRARGVLPKAVSHTDAVYNISRASLLTASIMSGRYDLLGTALQDRMHQPFRKCLIGGVNKIFKFGKDNNAYGTYISGSGPTIVSVIDSKIQNNFLNEAQDFLNKHMNNWSIKIVEIDQNGATVNI